MDVPVREDINEEIRRDEYILNLEMFINYCTEPTGLCPVRINRSNILRYIKVLDRETQEEFIELFSRKEGQKRKID